VDKEKERGEIGEGDGERERAARELRVRIGKRKTSSQNLSHVRFENMTESSSAKSE